MTKKIIQIIVVIMLLLFLVLPLTEMLKYKNKLVVAENLITALQDTLYTKINKDSSQTARINVLETQSAKSFTNLISKDLEINRLQNLVKKYESKLTKNSSATIITTETNVTNISPTTITKTDTVFQTLPNGNLQISYIYPEYKSNVNMGKWITGNVVSNKDSTKLNILVENDYDIVIGQTGFWRKKSFVELTNHNPYTKTKTLRTYKVLSPRPKRFGLGIYVGYGLSNNFILSPNIGLGLQYNLIRF